MQLCMQPRRQGETAYEQRSREGHRQNRLREFRSPLSGRADHPILDLGEPCDIMLRIAALEPGARFSRQASRRLQVSSMFENKCGFLKAARHVGTIERMRSQTTQISPLLSKNNSSSINPRFTMLATISQ